MVDNQHEKISGYRDLTTGEISLMNAIKTVEHEVAELWMQIGDDLPYVDRRCMALARTNLQDGFMWFVRAVAQPKDPFERSDRR